MIRLSQRTLQGMRRAYESTLDGFAVLYRLQKANTATGRSSSYTRAQVAGEDVDPIAIRVDAMVVDEEHKSSLIEKGNEAFLSVPVSAPVMLKGDQLRIIDPDTEEELQTYEVKGSAEIRSGVEFDRKYKAVRTA